MSTRNKYALDDAAARALWALRNAPLEHIGLLYEQEGVQATPTQTQHNAGRTKGSFAIPPGSLRGLFHNHPERQTRRESMGQSDIERAKFSTDDKKQARQLGVPSYIAAGHKLRRYDPTTGKVEDVLAEIPVDVIAAYFRSRLLGGDSGVP